MPSQMLDDKLCWALDEGFLQKMAVLIRRHIIGTAPFQKVAVADKKRRVKEDVLSALCYQAVFSQRCDTVGVA